MDHDSWLQIGMALHHQFDDAGFRLWAEWSAGCKAKYPGSAELCKRWQSFKSKRNDAINLRFAKPS